MWIVLIDVSGSMAEEFKEVEGLTDFRRTPRTYAARTKIQAARAALLAQLEQIGADTEVVLVAFDSTPREVCRGPASATQLFERAAEDLVADGGTDVAAALWHAVRLLGQATLPQVVIISDGLSDVDEAVAAARTCRGAGARVDMHLIDPIDEAREFAKAVTSAGAGRWEPVTSEEALIKAGQEAGRRSTALRSAVHAMEARLGEELARAVTTRASLDDVSFTGVWPERMVRDRRYRVTVAAHLSRLTEEVRRALTSAAATDWSPTVQTTTGTRIARGSTIEVVPDVPGVRFNPARRSVDWLEDRHDLDFDAYAHGAAGAPLSGQFDILVDGLPVAALHVSVMVTETIAPSSAAQRTVTMFDRVFASYARQDAAVVARCKEAYLAMGVHLFVDRDDILAGQPWESVLAKEIAASDLFQLFWSDAARASVAVRDEIAVAIDHAARVGPRFVRGVYWEVPMPPPPMSLAKSHFHQLDLGGLGLPAGPAIRRPAPPPVATPAGLATTVVPLERDPPPAFLDAVRAATARAIAAVEGLTELRYYPVPTLLVDRHLIQSIRTVVTVDRVSVDEDDASPDIRDLGERAGRLGVQFHTSVFELGKDRDPSASLAPWYGVGPDQEEELTGFKAYLEGFSGTVHDAIEEGHVQWPPYVAFQHPADGDPTAFLEELFERWLGWLSRARDRHPHHIVDTWWGEPRPLPEYQAEVVNLRRDVLAALGARAYQLQERRAQVVSTAQTFGVYVPARASAADRQLAVWADAHALAPRLVLPGAAKVLLCVDALDAYTATLTGVVDDPAAVGARFMASVLVHEHLHAVLDVGVDPEGRLSAAARGAIKGSAGQATEEALAAWAQRNDQQDDPELWSLLSAWIASGPWPGWPYAGAAWVEERFQAEGLAAVRELLRALHQGVSTPISPGTARN